MNDPRWIAWRRDDSESEAGRPNVGPSDGMTPWHIVRPMSLRMIRCGGDDERRSTTLYRFRGDRPPGTPCGRCVGLALGDPATA